jgi:hypothetical protein
MLMGFDHFKKNVILKTNSISYPPHLFSMTRIKKCSPKFRLQAIVE